jgi:hypothetical protein
MGKKAPRPDPLRSRATRVEKHRRPEKKFPAWYYRVVTLDVIEGYRLVYPEDFDEDLSELDEKEKDEASERECDCGNSECDCDEDTESERSYDGSEAEYYYELKDEREERKRELLEDRKIFEEAKAEMMEYEKAREDEVNAAYKSFEGRKLAKKDRKIPQDSILNQAFDLFSSDHVDRFFLDLDSHHANKSVHFYRDEDEVQDVSSNDGKQVGRQEKLIHGDVRFDSDTGCQFGPFPLPTHARRKTVRVKSHDGKYDLWFKFIGNGYLKLSVSRDLVFEHGLVSSPTAPEMFDFVGIWKDWENEMKEMAAKQERVAKNAPPSPRESWFETNHPMGSWDQGGW